MSLEKAIQTVGEKLRQIKEIEREAYLAIDGIKPGKERTGILDKAHLKTAPLKEKNIAVLRSTLELPDGIELVDVRADEGTGSFPPRVDLSLKIKGSAMGNFSPGQIYERTYPLRDNIPDSRYFIHVVYDDAPQLFNDDTFDLRAFDKIGVEKRGVTFTSKPFLVRDEFEGDLDVRYYVEEKEIWIGGICGEGIWDPTLRDIAEKFGGELEVRLEGKECAELAEGASFFGKWRSKFVLDSILPKTKRSRSQKKLVNALMTGFGFPFDRNFGKGSREGRISVDQMRELEELAGKSMNGSIELVKVPVNLSEDPGAASRKFRRLVDYLSSVNVSGTNPGEVRITRERARGFLEEDLKNAYDITREVPLSSSFTGGRFGSVVQGDRYEKLHLPLLRKLGKLTSLDLEKLFPNHCSDRPDIMPFLMGVKKQLPSEESYKPDKYSPNSVDEVVAAMERVNIPERMRNGFLRKLGNRVGDCEGGNGYLTIHELYDMHLEALNQLQTTHPERLLDHYLSLYQDVAAGPLSPIDCSSGATYSTKKPLRFPHPFIMANGGRNVRIDVTDGDDSLKSNSLDFFADGNEYKLSVRILPENPDLLPLQKYSLESLGIKIS